MEFMQDVVFLDRLQFAGTAIYHYMFVPLSIGFGLILAILCIQCLAFLIERIGVPVDTLW